MGRSRQGRGLGGLCPLTELEFEKAVRGLDAPEGTDAGLSFYGLQEVDVGSKGATANALET
jgi:hypothetical protein